MKENFKKKQKNDETHSLGKVKMTSIMSSGLRSRIIIILAISIILWLSAFWSIDLI